MFSSYDFKSLSFSHSHNFTKMSAVILNNVTDHANVAAESNGRFFNKTNRRPKLIGESIRIANRNALLLPWVWWHHFYWDTVYSRVYSKCTDRQTDRQTQCTYSPSNFFLQMRWVARVKLDSETQNHRRLHICTLHSHFTQTLSCGLKTSFSHPIWLHFSGVAQWKNVGLWLANCPWPAPICSWWVTIYKGKPSAVGQLTRPTQPFILLGLINE